MSQFKEYYFTEAKIQALPLDEENQATILDTLVKAAADGVLSDLTAELVSGSDTVFTITFREKDSTTTTTIYPHEVFVISTFGKFKKMGAEYFNSAYSPNVPAGIYLDQSILSE